MTHGSEISVIIPTFNEKTNLLNLIPRLLKASPPIRELIIADSQDSTDQIENAFDDPRIKIIKCALKRRSAQLNHGARQASGRILFFIHADMLPPESFVEDIMSASVDGFETGCFCYQFDKAGLHFDLLSSFSRKRNFFSGGGDQGLFVTSSIFNRMGGFREDLIIMEDFDFYARLKSNEISFSIIQNPGVISARKYDKNSFLTVNIIQLIVFIFYRLGLPQNWQLWIYRNGLKHR